MSENWCRRRIIRPHGGTGAADCEIVLQRRPRKPVSCGFILGEEEPVIRKLSVVPALLVILALAGASAATADPLPYIDWRDLVDTAKDGDHVVGEEQCAIPRQVADAFA